MSERSNVAPGDLVAILLPPGPSFLEAVTRLWAAGAAILPLDLRASQRELRAVIDLAAPLMIESTDGVEILDQRRPVGERTGLVMPTSGTSGTPKLAELSKEAVNAAVHSSTRALGSSPDVPWIACLTPAHIGGILVLLREALLGAPVIVHPGFDAERLAQAVSSGGDVCVSIVPTMLYRLLSQGGPLSGATILVGGGTPDPAAVGAAISAGARVVTTYGLTETTGGFAYNGHPFLGTEVRFAGGDAIEVRGPTIMTGYRRDPQATAQAFSTDGWLRTGDLGGLDEDGCLTVWGRSDELIRTGAEKVWPQEVERALADHPKVADVAVVGTPDPEWGQHVTAFVVPRVVEDLPSLEELQVHAEGKIARFKFPRELILRTEIPRTGSGKVRRRDLASGK